jgi:carbonic anhydrase/acetyltransferase-like protein (isoleucine patch superfamily)
MISVLIPTFYAVIYGGALMAAGAPFLYAEASWQKMAALGVAPVIFMGVFVLNAGLLSMIGAKAVFPGKFKRDLKDPVYGPRRLYGACWTAVFYFSPVYFVFLSVPPLKKFLFRMFGYKGPVDFTIYPDTWVRDLTCLMLEPGAYIANKSTLGTNMCLADGTILVDRIKVGKNAIVGHMAMIAPGVKLRDGVEIGVGASTGVRCEMKENSKLGPCSILHHGVTVGENSDIGIHSYIGLRAKIGKDVRLPPGAFVPAGAHINTSEDYEKLNVQQNQKVQEERTGSLSLIRGQLASVAGI